MTTADDLLDLATSDPQKAVERGHSYLDEVDQSNRAERSKTLRAMSLGARTGDIRDSIGYARAAADAAREGGHDELHLMALLTLSGSLAIGGDHGEALAVIDQGVEAAIDEHSLARFTYQKGALLALMGRHWEAIRAMESVLGIFRRLEDKPSLVLTLNQLGRMSTAIGELEKAEEHLLEAYELAEELGDNASLPGIQHNLGLLASYLGDIPTALRRLQNSDDMYMELSGAEAPQHVARCEVLLGVGRFEEAVELASRIAERNRKLGNREHEANAVLVAAQASLFLGDTDRAAVLADRAASLLGEDLASPRAIEARRVALEARFLSEGPSPALLDAARELSAVIAAEGHMVATSQASLLAGRISLALGEKEEADRLLDQVAGASAGPIELRLQARLARALQRLVREDRRGAAIAAWSGLRLIEDYQQALGATDLRMGLERQGVELGEIGLGLAIDARRPRRILEWMERTRARALRYRPVTPEGDDETSRLLAELRRVESEVRTSDGRGERDLLQRRRALQEEITRRDRANRKAVGHDSSFSTPKVLEQLGDRSLFEIAEHEGALCGVLVRRGRARLIDLGEAAPVVAELAKVRFGMRRAARLKREFDGSSLARLDEMLLGKVRAGGDIVVVPPPWLMAVPWPVLPRLADVTVTVSPSAEIWWRSTRSRGSGGAVVVAGGPDLAMASEEVETVAGLYEEPRVFPPGATVDEVRTAIEAASVAHIASHATFRVDNPMFSSLRLGDGDLNVYDIERLETPPERVVLSACDSGYSDARSGEELAGLTSALLSMGTRSVVASIGLVPDSVATSRLMVEFHRRLVDGIQPSRALADARSEMLNDPEGFVAAASFVCVGA